MQNDPKPVYCAQTEKTYPSIRSACIELNVKYTKMQMVLAKLAKTTRGYSFEWYDPEKHPRDG